MTPQSKLADEDITSLGFLLTRNFVEEKKTDFEFQLSQVIQWVRRNDQLWIRRSKFKVTRGRR